MESRHCERCEAIQGIRASRRSAPRNDGGEATLLEQIMFSMEVPS